VKRRVVRRTGLAVAAVSAVTLLLAPFAGAASAAASSAPVLAVRTIDATSQDAVKVTFLYSGDRTKLSKLTLREDGQVRQVSNLVSLDQTQTHLGTVFVVDLSGSMDDQGHLTAIKKGLDDFAQNMPTGDQMGLVSYNDDPVTESTMTDDVGQLTTAIDGMAAPSDGHTATYDAIRQASSLFEHTKKLQPNIVLITDGRDDVSTSSLESARAAVVTTGAAFFAVELDHADQVDTGAIDKIISRTGGSTLHAANASEAKDAVVEMGKTIHSQYVATYPSTATQGQVAVSISVEDQTKNASFVAGSTVSGGGAIQTIAEKSPFGPAFLRTKLGGVLGLALVGLAVGLGAFAVAALAGSADESLQAVLRPYSEGGVPVEDENDGALAQTAFLQRAVELTEEFAEKQGFLVKVEKKLEQADLPLRAAEALFFWGAAVALFTAGALALGGIFLGAILLVLTLMFPMGFVNFKAARRSKAFESSLPDMLNLLSGSLRAGYSLLQGVEAVSKEVQDPMGKELRRVITEARLGREVEDAMESVAERMNSADFAWAVMAVRIQREVGGNLSELLLTVADTMIHRERLRRDVAALTAEGKISAIILGLLPVGLGAFMWLSNPTYMHPLGATGMGHGLLAAAAVALFVGFAWMKKIININI
jgi:tight adherence protein B